MNGFVSDTLPRQCSCSDGIGNYLSLLCFLADEKTFGLNNVINSVLVWWELQPELRLSSTSLPRSEPSCSRR